MLSQNRSTNTNTKSKQTINERRNLRRDYRTLIQETQANKTDLVDPQSKGLLRLLEKGENLYNKVEQPREAALDSEFLSLTSQYGLEQAQSLKIASSIDSQGFITRIRDILLNEEQDICSEGWSALGTMVEKISYTTPPFNFMYGPMNLEVKEKKKPVRKPKVVDEPVSKKITAEQVKDTQVSNESETTSTRVQALKSFLDRKKSANFLDTVVDHTSFAKTVENLFYYSFLLKDGLSKLESNDSGIDILASKPPEEQDFKNGEATPKHSIIKMDFGTWQKLTQITEPIFNVEEEYNNFAKRNRSQGVPDNKDDPNDRPNKKSK